MPKPPKPASIINSLHVQKVFNASSSFWLGVSQITGGFMCLLAQGLLYGAGVLAENNGLGFLLGSLVSFCAFCVVCFSFIAEFIFMSYSYTDDQ